MNQIMNRRLFLSTVIAGAAAFSAGTIVRPGIGRAQAPTGQARTRLAIASRTIEVNGRAARVFGLLQANGLHGVSMKADEIFDVELSNEINEPTMIHWHGLTPPWKADGVPDNPLALIEPGAAPRYTFPVGKGGTHWMHAHTLQEQNLLAAPLIVRTTEDLQRDEQEVVVLLHDFSFKSPEELLARLQKGESAAMPMDHSKMGPGGMSGMPMMNGMAMGRGVSGMQISGMDLNDIEYDAYLANDRTLDDPEVVRVEKGGAVRLRIINGATATGFTIDTGSVEGTLVAVDGQDVEPIAGTTFPISMGQRLDVRLVLPAGDGAYPVLALREGATERTGLILATSGATVERIAGAGDAPGPVVSLSLEQRLRARSPLAVRPSDRRFTLTLTGGMQGYSWGIGGGGDLRARRGERIEITVQNMSMMSHPMHLHGHHFQVTAIDGAKLPGAVRDTVLVPPASSVTIAFDASSPGKWPLHCHHLYHMATGMMASLPYDDIG